jgi:SAM-dependent methyltransferase
MKKVHTSAKPSHYNKEAESYDVFNEESSRLINLVIGNIFKKHEIKSVLDLTCGTGSQVFSLTKLGYEVIGVDINSKMLKIALNKSKQEKLLLKFLKGDMRTTKIGEFDAVITIFNAIGHLTKEDFEVAMQNVHSNLRDGGLYIFDIFNLNYLLEGDNITKLTIDWQEVVDDIKVREIQYSTISEDGILTSYDTYYEQKGGDKPKISKSSQTLQIYTANQLTEMLHRNGFKVLDQFYIDGSKFNENESDRILTVAEKVNITI